jgi:hypothetical protein
MGEELKEYVLPDGTRIPETLTEDLLLYTVMGTLDAIKEDLKDLIKELDGWATREIIEIHEAIGRRGRVLLARNSEGEPIDIIFVPNGGGGSNG